MSDHPAHAFAKKSDSSIVRGFEALARGEIDGFASAGSTGAMMVGLNGLTVKSHGGTDALGFSVAVSNAANLVRQNFVSTIKSEIEKVDLDELSQEILYDMY